MSHVTREALLKLLEYYEGNSFHFTQLRDLALRRFSTFTPSGYYQFIGETAPERQSAFCLCGCWSYVCPFVNAVCVNRFPMMKMLWMLGS